MPKMPIALTLQERTILDRLARGFTFKQIMFELAMGRTSILVSMRVIRAKLGAKSTTHAVAIAVYERLIHPFDGDPREFNGRMS